MATQTLSDFLTARFNQLEHETDTLHARLAEIDAERAQLTKAAMAAGLSTLAPAATASSQAEGPGATMKDAVLAVLRKEGRGMTAIELLPRVNAYCGREFNRSSLSPQLSRLKVDEKIHRQGLVWHLAENENEAAGDDPDKDAPAASDVTDRITPSLTSERDPEPEDTEAGKDRSAFG